MSNDVVRDLFSQGSAEGDEELVAEDKQMEILDYDEDELRILQELENDLIQSPELSSQYEIRSNMRAELSLFLTSSPSNDMSAEGGATFFNLQTILPSAQEPQIASGTSLALSTSSEFPIPIQETPIQRAQKPKRKRRTKAQMIEFRVNLQFIKKLLSTCFSALPN